MASVLEDPTDAVTAEQAMPESEEMAATRLEAALERIARSAAERPPASAGSLPLSASDPRVTELATRLDALIASLKAVLGRQA